MYHTNKFPAGGVVGNKGEGGGADQVSDLSGSGVKHATPVGGSGKQRLRWTSDLHDRFVDAITQLGGPDSGYLLLVLINHHFHCYHLSVNVNWSNSRPFSHF